MGGNLSNIFKALSNEHRLTIFELIGAKELKQKNGELCCKTMASCVSDIAKKFNLVQSTVSHHLKELKNVGLIKTEKKGAWVYCSINYNTIRILKEFFNKY